MEASGSRIFCKFCGKQCLVLKSRSVENPNREYFSCPTKWNEGGHGWQDWVDGARCPTSRLNTMSGGRVDLIRDQLAFFEAKLKLLEEVRAMEGDRLSKLQEELVEAKRQIKCLTKVLKVITVCFTLWLLFSCLQ